MSQAFLEVPSRSKGVKRVPLGDAPVTLGRHPENEIIIRDEEASRKHCIVEKTNDGYRVRDLKSRNGTRVNGDKTRGCLLQNEDVIRIGETKIRFIFEVISPARKMPPLPTGDPDDPESIALEADDANTDDDAPRRRAPQLSKSKRQPRSSRNNKKTGDNLAGLARDHCKDMLQKIHDVPGDSPDARDIILINARGDTNEIDSSEENNALAVLRVILTICMHLRATDIHIEPKRGDYQVRLRVDGMMIEIGRMHKDIGTRMNSAVKVLGDIDISQRNIVQEGTFSVEVGDRHVDYRVSFTPTTFGQKLVVRVLDLANAPQYLSEMDVPPWTQKSLKQVMQQDTGMVLVSGPTGSGKTTSLYALIREIDTGQRNVVTIEDPVEYHIEGITQIPINEMQGNSFSSVLRSVLRQDPDVILVGEIRDSETARIAMQAAITGHLVLSTVHARDTIGAIFRLLDLGVEPYVLGSGLNLVLAQRLVRKLCGHCKLDKKPTPEELRKMGLGTEGLGRIYRASECDRCLHTGYIGRRGIFELLTANEQLRDVILNQPTIADLKAALKREMFATLGDSGYKLVAEGVTSVDEIDRVVGVGD